MKKKIAILGSTGSMVKFVKNCRKDIKKFEMLLTANKKLKN